MILKVLDMVAIDTDKIGTVDKTTGKTVKVDLDRQLLKPLAGSGKMFCYDSPEYVKDMGTTRSLPSGRRGFQSRKSIG